MNRRFSKLFDLTGRVAIVTGGTRGIGRSLAEGLVCAGAKVVVASRKADACAETEAHLTAMGGEALGVATHMGDLDALAGARRRHRRALRRHRHRRQQRGQRADAAVGRVHADAWNKSYDVNLRGPVFLVQYASAAPQGERARGGGQRDLGGRVPRVHAAVDVRRGQGRRSWRSRARRPARGRSSGIRVNALAPGTIDTDMVRNNPPEAQARMAAASPMKRAAHADEMIGPVMFLVSDAGSFMTGQVVLADGGMVPH